MIEDRPHRNKKIAELLHREVAKFVLELVPVPEGTLVTISHVVPSANHQHATAFVTVFPFAESEAMINLIEKHIGEIQYSLNRELNMRPVPKIRFVLDESEEKARKIFDILDEDPIKN